MAQPEGELQAEEILRRLTARGVDFVVIGGIAAVLHGSAQMTFDLDICYATDGGNLAALADVLTALGAKLRGVDDAAAFVADARALRRVEILTLSTELGELDLIARPAGGAGYETLRRRADRFDLNGSSVLVASVEDLISMKSATGRLKDLAAVEELEAIRRLRSER